MIGGIASFGDTARDTGDERIRAADAFGVDTAVLWNGIGRAGFLRLFVNKKLEGERSGVTVPHSWAGRSATAMRLRQQKLQEQRPRR